MNDIENIGVPIKGFEDSYLIYPDGAVFSIKKQAFRKPVLYNNGYYCVMLKAKGIRKHFLIHRLVAMAFIENKDKKDTVNHIDGDKLNNKYSNLEWLSLKDNIRHGFANGLMHVIESKKGSDHPKSIFSKDDISAIRRLRSFGLTYKDISEQFNCHLATICNIVKMRTYAN